MMNVLGCEPPNTADAQKQPKDLQGFGGVWPRPVPPRVGAAGRK
jgi:hypothetical protein